MEGWWDGGAGERESGVSFQRHRPLSRSLRVRRKLPYLLVRAGPAYKPVRRKLPADITKEMLDSGSWESETFKSYNWESAGKEVSGGHEHVLMKVRAEFRQILLEMG